MKVSAVLVALTAAPLVVGCSLIRLPTVSLGAGTTATASAAEPASAAATSPFASMPDTEFAALAVKLLLGEAHQITEFEPGKPGEFPFAKGTFAYSNEAEEKAFSKRFIALVAKHRKLDEYELVEKVLPKEFCANQVKLAVIKGRTPAEAEALCREAPESLFRVSPLRSDRGLAVLFLDALLPSLANDEARAAATLKMAQRLGWSKKPFKIHYTEYEAGGGYTLEPTPVKEWARPWLAFALGYAQQHGAPAPFVAELEAALAQAPKERCFWSLLVVTRDGSGQGAIHYEPRFNVTEKKTTDELSCAELSKVRSDPALLKVMKSEYHNTFEVRAVHQHDKDWVIERNSLGVPVRQTLAVKTYLVERFAP